MKLKIKRKLIEIDIKSQLKRKFPNEIENWKKIEMETLLIK